MKADELPALIWGFGEGGSEDDADPVSSLSLLRTAFSVRSAGRAIVNVAWCWSFVPTAREWTKARARFTPPVLSGKSVNSKKRPSRRSKPKCILRALLCDYVAGE